MTARKITIKFKVTVTNFSLNAFCWGVIFYSMNKMKSDERIWQEDAWNAPQNHWGKMWLINNCKMFCELRVQEQKLFFFSNNKTIIELWC